MWNTEGPAKLEIKHYSLPTTEGVEHRIISETSFCLLYQQINTPSPTAENVDYRRTKQHSLLTSENAEDRRASIVKPVSTLPY